MNDIFSIIIILGITIAIFLLLRMNKKPSQEDNLLIMQRLNELNQVLDNKLAESNRNIQNQYGQSIKIIQDVTEKLTKLDETNKQVIGFADQLQSLEDILKNPKQRGILGEYYLEELLKNVFNPSQYQMQYKFRDGETVDAVIFVRDKLIPIDSKFSLENYNRIVEERNAEKREELEKIFKQDLKNRIDETAKYIRPAEKTMEFAFMFIPAEAIYYDLLVNKIGAVKTNTRDLVDYAVREKHVHIVSPTSFYAYLQTIIQGLRALQIEESAKEIKKRVEMLGRHIANYDEYFRKLGNNLSTTVNCYNSAYREFGKIDKDVVKIAEREPAIEVKELKKPQGEMEE
ncbi:MAG: DNA recombination protein RmuC [Candidatus Pacebacteria bacterium]|nr:DNA recombination protein RmuC [Candidatus Paceibacterota bacterium]